MRDYFFEASDTVSGTQPLIGNGDIRSTRETYCLLVKRSTTTTCLLARLPLIKKLIKKANANREDQKNRCRLCKRDRRREKKLLGKVGHVPLLPACSFHVTIMFNTQILSIPVGERTKQSYLENAFRSPKYFLSVAFAKVSFKYKGIDYS